MALLAEIEPVPAFKLSPDVAKVTVAPPAELLKIESASLPEESESDLIFPDKLIASISVVPLAAPIVTSPVAVKLPEEAIVS